jgi:small GTP-binding protein
LIKIWDTCGQEQFRSLTANYFRNAEGVILAYDVTDDNSFVSLKSWITSIKENCKTEIPKIIIGNKVDSEKRAVSMKQAKQFAESNKVKNFEVSAKNNVNVTEAFNSLFLEIVKIKKTKEHRMDSIRISEILPRKKKSGCMC